MNYAENKAAAADFGVAKVIVGRFFLRRRSEERRTSNSRNRIGIPESRISVKTAEGGNSFAGIKKHGKNKYINGFRQIQCVLCRHYRKLNGLFAFFYGSVAFGFVADGDSITSLLNRHGNSLGVNVSLPEKNLKICFFSGIKL